MPQYASNQIIGARSEQQDKITVWQGDDGGVLAIIADGMGGETGGALASRVATETFLESFVAHIDEVSLSEKTVEQLFKDGLQNANDEIATLIENDSKLDGMGTTFLASYIKNNQLYWISVGDSILLLYRKGDLTRLNADHSFQTVLDAQVKAGDLSAEEAAKDSRRSLLFSALCGKTVSYVDFRFNPLILEGGDILISASDGILSMSFEDIRHILNNQKNSSPTQIVKKIMDSITALDVPKQDNASVIVQTIET